MAQTYYDVLDVAENATDSAIEAAFKSKAREVHPDRVGSNSPYLQRIAAEAFKELSEARSVLLDHHRREKYDAALAYLRGSSASTAPPVRPPPPPPSASTGVPHSPSTQAAAPWPSTSQPATKPSFWKPTNTTFGTLALLCLALVLMSIVLFLFS